MSFDNLPFNFIRDAVDLASVNKPSLLLEWRLINSQWKSVVEAVLSARAWYIQRRRLGFDRLAQSTAFDENSRILRGLETLIIESDTTPQFTENVDEIFVGDLAFTKKFVESPQDELNKKVVFVHGCGGNGTTFFLNSMGRYFSKFDYNVLFIDGSIYNVLPNLDCLEESIEVLRQKSKAILIIDDSDKLLLDHMRGVSEWNASVDWCLQKDKLTALIESLQSADIRIILASNGCSLMTEELGKFIAQVVHVPCKHQKDRLHLLSEFTREIKLCDDVKMEDIVRRLNGHVIRALKCVCQRAASIAILNGFPCVKNVCFDKAIQYVVFRQNIRPFVIRPRPNMASLHMDSPASSTMQNIDFNVERMVKNKGRIYSRRLALAKAVQKRKNILFGSSSSLEDGTSLTNSQRRDAWESVRQDLLLKGFSEFASKSRLDIQKTDWQHVRRYVMDKRKKDSPNKDDPISELDTVVFDIVKSFGRYSTRDSGDNNAEDNDMLMDEVNQYINGTSPTISTRNEYSLEENGALPQLSQLLNLQFHPETVESPPLDRNNDVQTKIAEVRLQREEYLRDQQKIRVDIENERLLQERIKTKILLAQLASEDPEVANEFKISD